MATFHGTTKEFHDFIGPRIRNKVNYLTRKQRLQRNGVCEFCNKTSELQSAHVHGRDRRTIIELALKPHTDSAGVISCSIEKVEHEILEAHMPIEKTFKFICHSCHVEYDSKEKEQKRMKKTRTSADPEFEKLSRIKLWANRPHQINNRIIKAYLQLEKKSTHVSLTQLRKLCIEEFSIDKFDSHFASMKTDVGNSHGNVFYEQNQLVKIWPRVRQEIDKHFK